MQSINIQSSIPQHQGNDRLTTSPSSTAHTSTATSVTDTTDISKQASAIIATDAIKLTAAEYDLTQVTPDQVTALSAKLFEEGRIGVQQMVRLHSIALNHQHPPNSEGIYRDETANNTPFNLLEKVEQRQQQSPLLSEIKPLLETLLGLQNARDIESYQSIHLSA